MNAQDLIQEHQNLKEKYLNIELDEYYFTIQMNEVIQDLKYQLIKEKNQVDSPKVIFKEFSFLLPKNEVDIIKELEDTMKKRRLIQEEINITNRHLELIMKKNV